VQEDLQLNVPLLRRRVPNLTVAARSVGLRPATVSDLCNGKIPVGRAEVRTLAALAALAGCSLDELVLRGGGAGVIETGIKLLDLMAPLVRGGTAAFMAPIGLGHSVVPSELVHRLRQKGFATFVWLPSEVHPHMTVIVDEADASATLMANVRQQLALLRAERNVLVVADRATVLTGELFALREQLQEAGARPLTFALVDMSRDAPDEDAPYGPLETLWRFDTDMLARRIFPAVNPIGSTSTLLEGGQLEATHLAVQQRARKLLRRYRELRSLVAVLGPEKLSPADVTAFRRGERLEAFLTQPLFVTEPLTKLAGAWVSLPDTIDSVRRILDGGADEIEVKDLMYVGRLGWPLIGQHL
jgi:F-type H+-transporting ATPase subunit beta